MIRRGLLASAGVGLAVLIGLGVWLTGDRRVPPPPAEPPVEVAPDPAAPHITATLFYASPDGQGLVPVRREVPLAEAQGAEILRAQLAPPPAPYTSVIPAGTALRAFYVTEGEAFVDLSPDVSTKHPGGSLAELLTVYAIVNAVTVNLPAVQRVQLLVGGREVDTIAGHVAVRRPLARDVSLVREE